MFVTKGTGRNWYLVTCLDHRQENTACNHHAMPGQQLSTTTSVTHYNQLLYKLSNNVITNHQFKPNSSLIIATLSACTNTLLHSILYRLTGVNVDFCS